MEGPGTLGVHRDTCDLARRRRQGPGAADGALPTASRSARQVISLPPGVRSYALPEKFVSLVAVRGKYHRKKLEFRPPCSYSPVRTKRRRCGPAVRLKGKCDEQTRF